MPKLKNHSGSSKRFKRTASGKYKRRHNYKSHILNKKPTKRLRKLRKAGLISDTDHHTIKRMLPT